jgi:glycosyltransferase involved in cell wall biosynthesis
MNATVKPTVSVPVVSVFSPSDSDWDWYAKDCEGKSLWDFHTEEPGAFLGRRIQNPRLCRAFGAFRCALSAKRLSSKVVVALSSRSLIWIAFALRLCRIRIPLLAFSYHFTELPKGARHWIVRWAASRVQRFQVHSEVEKARYADYLGISIERFDLVRFGVAPSSVCIEEAPPPIDKPYICALGKDGRDYQTLIEAMKQLPDITLIVVAQPYNLRRVEIPENVKVYYNIPRDLALNILKHSLLMALPLKSEEISCGHITLVSAMYYRKAIVATRSSGIADYFPLGYDAPRVPAGDVDGWAKALRAMCADPEWLGRCGAAGERFAYQYCSHDACFRRTMEVFRNAGFDVG